MRPITFAATVLASSGLAVANPAMLVGAVNSFTTDQLLMV
jgi:hypothetical protein